MADMTHTKEALLPCPNRRCQDDGVELINTHKSPSGGKWFKVVCEGCGMTGPGSMNPDHAVSFWQALPRPTTTPGAVEVVEEMAAAALRRVERHVAGTGIKDKAAFSRGEHQALLQAADKLRALPTLIPTVDAVEVVEREAVLQVMRSLADDLSAGKLPSVPAAWCRLFDDIRALPQPDTGFAAGVAACVEKIEKQLADYTGIACGDEGPFTTDYAAGMNEGGIRALTDALKAFRKLSPTPAHDNALVEALRPFVEFAQNVDDNGWISNIHQEPISYWFGPSDFRAARQALTSREKGQ